MVGILLLYLERLT